MPASHTFLFNWGSRRTSRVPCKEGSIVNRALRRMHIICKNTDRRACWCEFLCHRFKSKRYVLHTQPGYQMDEVRTYHSLECKFSDFLYSPRSLFLKRHSMNLMNHHDWVSLPSWISPHPWKQRAIGCGLHQTIRICFDCEIVERNVFSDGNGKEKNTYPFM